MSISNGIYTITNSGSGFALKPQANPAGSGLVVDADDASDTFKVRTFDHLINQYSGR